MRILQVASEAMPFIKTGGLADVVYSLSKELVKQKHKVSVIIPLYKDIAIKYHNDFKFVCNFKINSNIIKQDVNVYTQTIDNIDYYFIECQKYFERDNIYGYWDDGERYSFFNLAVLNFIRHKQIKVDICHIHDWQTGIMPLMNRIYYKDIKTKYVYTIHNLAYQGIFPKELMKSCLAIDYTHYKDGLMKFNDCISFMKTAILISNKITTVSPTYAKEILTEQYGEHLNNVLYERKADTFGVLNGIDYSIYNPNVSAIHLNYNINNVLKGKKTNKLYLQEQLGLNKDENILMISIISRLSQQKGLNLVLDRIQDILKLKVQIVVLGTGDKYLEDKFKELEYYNKGKFVFYCGYNENLAHQIYASSDLFLMPSLYEPCGLSQIIAMKYGTLPIVRETGGLKDTVIPFNEYTNEGTGFSFSNIDSYDMYNIIKYAYNTYYKNKRSFNKLVKNAMKQNFSFKESAKLYIGLYKELVDKD